jgi:DNA N-6-adenine-methyltransferase (Dam)/Protein of unknown function (DUF3102)
LVPPDSLLVQKAAVIHALIERTKENIIEIGRHLVEVRDRIDHGEWLAWINAEFHWSDQTARNFIHVYELSLDPNSKRVLDLDLPLRVFYQLAGPTAEGAREEITKRAEAGEPISQETVLAAIADRRKSPATAPAEPSNTENEDASADQGGDQAAAEPATNVEWYTPAKYIDLARRVLGEIDLDPASCAMAQDTVGAKQFFTKEDDGLTKPWPGRVFLNPPYTQPYIANFVDKLIAEREAGHTEAAILLVNAFSSSKWFHRAAAAADAICFTRMRVPFDGADGEVADPKQGQAFIFFGDDVQLFASVFSEIGLVVTSISAGRDEKLAGFLRAIPIKTVIGVFGEQLRAALPMNPLLKLREMDTTTAAETLAEAFGARFEKIVEKVHALRAPRGARKSGIRPRPFQRGTTFEKTVNKAGNPVFAQSRGSRIRH